MRSKSILQDAVEGRAIVYPWTVDLYHRAIAGGWLEESTAFELLDGFIVRKDRAKAGEPSGDHYQEVASLRTGDRVELRAGEHGLPVPVNHLLP